MLILLLTYIDENERLFEDIFNSYKKQMFLVANSILHNQADAEDTVSDVFFKIATKNWDIVSQIKDDNDLRNYLLKATKNTALNQLKNNKKKVLDIDSISENYIDYINDVSDEKFVKYICDKMSYEQILDEIKNMDEKYRNVLYFHFVLELSVKQTARTLGQSISATKKQLVRGKKILLKSIERKE